MDCTTRGAFTEATFLILALEQGWEVATPFGGSHAYDFVVRRTPDAAWETVQVKTAYHGKRNTKDRLEVGFRRSKGKASGMQCYAEGDFDLLFASYGSTRWLIPWDAVCHLKSVVLVGTPKYEQFKI